MLVALYRISSPWNRIVTIGDKSRDPPIYKRDLSALAEHAHKFKVEE